MADKIVASPYLQLVLIIWLGFCSTALFLGLAPWAESTALTIMESSRTASLTVKVLLRRLTLITHPRHL